MRPSHLYLLSLVLASSIGCGGGGGSSAPDAKVFMDAPVVVPDAPGELTALGKRCVLAMGGADCPSTANGCFGPFVQGGTMGFCTVICVNAGTFMTDNASAPINIQPADLTAQNAQCAGIYQGPAVGTASCTPGMGGVLFNRMPNGALTPNTNYTYQIACGIGCGAGDTCPGTLTCNATSKLCEPL